jgi:anti-anti-sigma factor
VSELATLVTSREDALVVACIDGEVDPSNARVLGHEITAEVPNDAMGVVLDLTEVEYLDSSGVQMVFELAERLDGRQQRLAVVVPDGAPARAVLEIVSVDAIAALVGTRNEAIERLSGSA